MEIKYKVVWVLSALVGIPLAAWVGARLSRERRPLHGFTGRHFWPSLVVVTAFYVGASAYRWFAPSVLAGAIQLIAALAGALMLVPVVRRIREGSGGAE